MPRKLARETPRSLPLKSYMHCWSMLSNPMIRAAMDTTSPNRLRADNRRIPNTNKKLLIRGKAVVLSSKPFNKLPRSFSGYLRPAARLSWASLCVSCSAVSLFGSWWFVCALRANGSLCAAGSVLFSSPSRSSLALRLSPTSGESEGYNEVVWVSVSLWGLTSILDRVLQNLQRNVPVCSRKTN